MELMADGAIFNHTRFIIRSLFDIYIQVQYIHYTRIHKTIKGVFLITVVYKSTVAQLLLQPYINQI